MTLSQNSFLIVVLAIVSIGITAGTVVATQTFSEDVIINSGGGEDGNLIVNDGRFGLGATPGTNQIIFAKGKDGIPASFRVDGVNSAAVFSLRATGGDPVLQFVNDDTSQTYQARLMPDDSFAIRDATSLPPEARMIIYPNGTMCLGDC